jgi:hypothetical protein
MGHLLAVGRHLNAVVQDTFNQALEALREHGLLFVTDARLPNLATIVAGEPVRGSWWGHPRGGDIYAVASLLDAHAEVGDARLLSDKSTWVHQRLWPALVAVGTAREEWQMARLAPLAQRLYEVVRRDGVARTDDLDELGVFSRKLLGDAARALEGALLAHGESIHTEAGFHAKRLETWEHWAARLGLDDPLPEAAAARQHFEELVAALNARFGGAARLPWAPPRTSTRTP